MVAVEKSPASFRNDVGVLLTFFLADTREEVTSPVFLADEWEEDTDPVSWRMRGEGSYRPHPALRAPLPLRGGEWLVPCASYLNRQLNVRTKLRLPHIRTG